MAELIIGKGKIKKGEDIIIFKEDMIEKTILTISEQGLPLNRILLQAYIQNGTLYLKGFINLTSNFNINNALVKVNVEIPRDITFQSYNRRTFQNQQLVILASGLVYLREPYSMNANPDYLNISVALPI